MNTPHLEKLLARAWPAEAWADVSVLVAVSGGADSVALLRGLSAFTRSGDGRLVVAHFNHQLRGEESDADEQFVGRLAVGLGLEFECGRLDRGVSDTGSEGLEEAARNQRYRFLTDAAEKVGARYVACAHTADDQIETILHRIVRGTGLAGLAGMPRCRQLSPAVTLIRPLLEVRRAELLDYLTMLGQPFREDRSNSDLRFTRNRLRHELLPHLAENYNSAVGDALLRLGRLAGEAQTVVDGLVRNLIARGGVETVDETTVVRRDRIQGHSEYLLREVFLAVWQSRNWPLQSMGFDEWNLLVQMLLKDPESCNAVPDKRTFPGPIQAESRADGLYLRGV